MLATQKPLGMVSQWHLNFVEFSSIEGVKGVLNKNEKISASFYELLNLLNSLLKSMHMQTPSFIPQTNSFGCVIFRIVMVETPIRFLMVPERRSSCPQN